MLGDGEEAMSLVFDSVLSHNTGPKQKRHSALFEMLRDHWAGVPKSAMGARFYRPNRLIRALLWSSERKRMRDYTLSAFLIPAISHRSLGFSSSH